MIFLRPTESSRFLPAILVLLLASSFAQTQQRHKVIINEDCSGPGGSNLQTLLVMIQSPQVEVLGITVVSGDQWRDEEVAHTLRLLEIIGRTDIPVVPGAVFPLVHRREEAQLWRERYGKVAYAVPGMTDGGTGLSSFRRCPKGSPRSSLLRRTQLIS